ncbi:HDL063Cp [Eremothecium sinecaudum]|uniref:HDL063Cp n=1 Tax=Eremothecium sinecaudum TaxID=45286 RepID=A0A0X8HRR6_9SACH|nr:HDL063Cp [Eremothecium sinecaudum]AMD20681.1 HDL063Cp [Eremothecium sinecaudum]
MASKSTTSIKPSKKKKLNDSSAKKVSVRSTSEAEETVSISKASSSDEAESDVDAKDEQEQEQEQEQEKEEEQQQQQQQQQEQEQVNDEIDEEGVTSEEIEEQDEDDFPRKKKSSNSKHDDGSESFSNALSNILSSHLKSYDRKDPILARNKKVLKQNEADKLELKARKALLAEKKQLLNKARKRDILPVASSEEDPTIIRLTLEKERKLRKIAQKGVVKLFNAILSTQVKTEKEIETNLANVKNRKERKELITEVSKERFLDLVKAAGDS